MTKIFKGHGEQVTMPLFLCSDYEWDLIYTSMNNEAYIHPPPTTVPRKYSSETNFSNNLSVVNHFAYFFLDFGLNFLDE